MKLDQFFLTKFHIKVEPNSIKNLVQDIINLTLAIQGYYESIQWLILCRVHLAARLCHEVERSHPTAASAKAGIIPPAVKVQPVINVLNKTGSSNTIAPRCSLFISASSIAATVEANQWR